jgi:hypothetical protein
MGGELRPLQQNACPNCGYCPHCGRGGHHAAPYYSPYYTPYTVPYMPTYWGPLPTLSGPMPTGTVTTTPSAGGYSAYSNLGISGSQNTQ